MKKEGNMKNLEKYAELIVKSGINVQQGQLVVISISSELSSFAEVLVKAAYEAGAGDVKLRWHNQLINRMRLDYASKETLADVRPWVKDMFDDYADSNAAFISVNDYYPDVMKGVDMEKMAIANKAMSEAVSYYRSRNMSNYNAWCVVAFPTVRWAKAIFPEKSHEEAFNALWEAILKASHADGENVIADWEAHSATLVERLNFMNNSKFDSLHYTAGNGTDLVVGLPKGHIWCGGKEKVNGKGYEFSANIPTEEVFSAPDYRRIDGKIYSTKPLIYQGNYIDEFWFEFKDGKVVDCGAEKGEDALKSMVSLDEGASYLGEVALVAHDSPISNMNHLFYSTLYDENASCHFAVGKAYPICLEGGIDMDVKELKEHGINDSITHVDFMVGCADMKIVGKKADGTEVTVMENGDFVF